MQLVMHTFLVTVSRLQRGVYKKQRKQQALLTCTIQHLTDRIFFVSGICICPSVLCVLSDSDAGAWIQQKISILMGRFCCIFLGVDRFGLCVQRCVVAFSLAPVPSCLSFINNRVASTELKLLHAAVMVQAGLTSSLTQNPNPNQCVSRRVMERICWLLPLPFSVSWWLGN